MGGSLFWFFFSFNGKVRRLPFALGYIVFLAAIYLGSSAFSPPGGNLAADALQNYLALTAIMWISFYSGFALSVKRLHDCGRSGWLSLLYFVPVLNLVLLLYLLFKGGAPAFSEPPEESGKSLQSRGRAAA